VPSRKSSIGWKMRNLRGRSLIHRLLAQALWPAILTSYRYKLQKFYFLSFFIAFFYKTILVYIFVIIFMNESFIVKIEVVSFY